MEDLGTLCHYDDNGKVVFESISRYCYADWPKGKNIHKGIRCYQGHYTGVIFDSNTKEFTECPYVWKNVKFISIERCDPHPQYPNYDHGCTLSATIEISSDDNTSEPILRTFIFRNGLGLFLGMVVSYICTYISTIKSIDGLNWGYLENLGLEWNWYVANGQSNLTSTKLSYVMLIIGLQWTHYSHYVPQCGRLHERAWDTYKAEFSSDDYDKYLVYMIENSLKKYFARVWFDGTSFEMSLHKHESFDDDIIEVQNNYRDDRIIASIIIDVLSQYNETDRIIKLLSK